MLSHPSQGPGQEFSSAGRAIAVAYLALVLFATAGGLMGGGLAWMAVWAVTLPTSWALGACFDSLGYGRSSGAFLLSVGLAALAQTVALRAAGAKVAQLLRHKDARRKNGADENA
jgi:hypothetical protein